jgi:hypothetical protein
MPIWFFLYEKIGFLSSDLILYISYLVYAFLKNNKINYDIFRYDAKFLLFIFMCTINNIINVKLMTFFFDILYSNYYEFLCKQNM